jgi:HK97 gp10 family phage protein
MSASLVITGDKKLAAQFRSLSNATQGTMLARAAKAGAQLIANDAKQRVHKVSGDLGRSIDVGTPEIGGDSVEVKVGTDKEYARREELGFAGADSLGRVYNQPPHPYLRPALETQKGAVEAEVGASVRALLRGAV